jgi:Zn-dependent protease with chaperone function
MITLTASLQGQYFDGIHPVGVPGVLVFEKGKVAALTLPDISERYPLQRLSVSPRIGRADRFIYLPDGAQFQCPDHTVLDSLPQESPSEGFVAWLEERWGIALAGVAIITAIMLAGYFYGLPAAANYVASRIPMATEQALGRQAIVWLDSNEWFKPTNLKQEKQKAILNGFDILRSDLPLKDYYRLEFRNSAVIGPNAFALPGGTIVIIDAMVEASQSPEEVVAIVAHEMGHIELRHAMRSILQNSAIAVVATAITSDAASLSLAVGSMPALLAQTKYSREFETAADEYAFRLLKKHNYSPASFASIMERLSEIHGKKPQMINFISTHPVTEERIKRARTSAERDD